MFCLRLNKTTFAREDQMISAQPHSSAKTASRTRSFKLALLGASALILACASGADAQSRPTTSRGRDTRKRPRTDGQVGGAGEGEAPTGCLGTIDLRKA